MAFYLTMSAFIAANLLVIGFELRMGPQRQGRALALAPARGMGVRR